MSSEHCIRVNSFSIDPRPYGIYRVVCKVVLAALGWKPRCFFAPSTKAPIQCPCAQPYRFSFEFPTLSYDVKVLNQLSCTKTRSSPFSFSASLCVHWNCVCVRFPHACLASRWARHPGAQPAPLRRTYFLVNTPPFPPFSPFASSSSNPSPFHHFLHWKGFWYTAE